MKRKYTEKTKIGSITRNKPIPASAVKVIIEAYQTNLKVFGTGLSNLKIVICDNTLEWEQACKYYHVPFARGCVLRDGTICIKSKQFGQMSNIKFKKLLLHEINHAFWLKKFSVKGVLWQPFWICEGFACLVGKDSFIKNKQATAKRLKRENYGPKALLYSFQPNKFKSKQDIITYYSCWYHILGHGCSGDLSKVVKFMKSYKRKPSRESYETMYLKHFSSSPKEHFLETFL